MSKAKARFLTGLVGVMVLMIAYGLSRLYPRVYLACLSVMGVVGYVSGLVLLYRWTRPEERVRAYLAPPVAAGGGPSQSLRDSSPGGDAGETVRVRTPGEPAGAVGTAITEADLERIVSEVGEWEKVTA